MEFFLPFQVRSFPFKISYPDKVLFMGSCFSEEIGNKMADLKFDVLQNPNGILYDPISISDALFSYIDNETFDEKILFELNGLWHSWKHHSLFSGPNKKEVLQKINDSVYEAHLFLKQTKTLIITLGTAFNYQLKEGFKNVANCHKAPGTLFIKTLLPVEQIKADLSSAIAALKTFNPGLKIIFTISPVKHLKEGVVENSRSKARLLEAAHLICDEKDNVFYYPAYELVNDVLRDYRFYKEDLAHPNETAIDFVFEKFSHSFFDDKTKEITKEIEKILTAMKHKPFHKESEAHQKFIASQIQNIRYIESACPFIDFSKEKDFFQQQVK